MRRANWWLRIGLASLCLLTALAVAPGLIAPNDPEERFWPVWDEQGYMVPRPLKPGQFGLIAGSDNLGRDLLSRTIYGARYSLGLAVGVTVLRVLIALPLGLWTGWGRGRLSRSLGALSGGLTTIPILLILIILLRPLQGLAIYRGGDWLWLLLFSLLVAMGGVPRLAEGIRRRVAAEAGAPYLEGAVALGADRRWILRRHLLPGLLPELAVITAAEVAWVLLLLGQLGIARIYVGGGFFDQFGDLVSVYPEWAQMLAVARGAILRTPWLLWVPGLALSWTAITFHVTAEGLRRRWQRLPTH